MPISSSEYRFLNSMAAESKPNRKFSVHLGPKRRPLINAIYPVLDPILCLKWENLLVLDK